MTNFHLLIFIFVILIQFGKGCISEDSREKSNCGCESYNFMKKKGKRFFCERTKSYRHVFLNSNFPDDLISIQLSQSDITEISNDFFPVEIVSTLENVIELSLSNNEIVFIATGAFQFFRNLKSLNLSYNKIGRLHEGMFNGLGKLRKLFLSYNTFPIIPDNAFGQLNTLRLLNVRSDYLVCNCLMKDFFHWYLAKKSARRFKLTGKCQYPATKYNKELCRVAEEVDSLNCGLPTTLPLFQIQPSRDQLVFTGDQRLLYCEGTDLSQSSLVWSLNGSVVNGTVESYAEHTSARSNQSTVASYVTLNVTSQWSGSWECRISSNYSEDVRAVRLIVIDSDAVYCDDEVVRNDFGFYHWPQAVSGVEVSLNCSVTSKSNNNRSSTARRLCLRDGTWDVGDYSRCLFTDLVAGHLAKLVGQGGNITSMEGVCNLTATTMRRWRVASVSGMKLLAEFMRECKQSLAPPQSVSDIVVDLVSLVMTSSPSVSMVSQQSFGVTGAVSRMLDEVLRSVKPRDLYIRETANLGVLLYKRDTSMTCNVVFTPNKTAMHCNRSSSRSLQLQPGVHVPLDGVAVPTIRIVIYRNGRLCQLSPNQLLLNLTEYLDWNNSIDRETASDDKLVPLDEIEVRARPLVFVSHIYSVLPTSGAMLNCSKPLELVFRTEEKVLLRDNHHFLMAWVVDRWRKVEDKECEPILAAPNNITMVRCARMGTYAIIKNLDGGNNDFPYPAHQLLHPSVYITASLLSFALFIIIVTYLIFPSLLISLEAKQAVINSNLHILLAVVIFVTAVKRVDNENLCYACGVILHYSSLSALMWLLLAARIMGKEMVASQQPPPPEPKPRRPIIRFYLLACGIPIIICGITAAAKIQNYHDEESKFCWLSWDTSIYAFYVPSALTALSCLLVLLRILATLSSDVSASANHKHPHGARSDATELTPLHGSSPAQASSSSLNKQIFNEQNFGCRLRGVAVTLILYVLTWVFAALVVASPEIEALPDTLSATNGWPNKCSRKMKLNKSFEKNEKPSPLILESGDLIPVEPTEASSRSAAETGIQYLDELTVSSNESDTLSLVFSCLLAASSTSFSIFLFHHHISSRKDATMRWKWLLCLCKRKSSLDAIARHDNSVDVITHVKPPKKNNILTRTSVTEDATLESVLPTTPRGTSNLHGGDSDDGKVLEDETAAGNAGSKLRQSSPHLDIQPRRLDNECHMANKPVKLTNLQLRVHHCVGSNHTDHSPDDDLNMHTVPVTLQRPPNLDNALLTTRSKKIRKNLEARRHRKRKLRVLRDFAHDPLTSNDEKTLDDHETSDEETLGRLRGCPVDEQMMNLLAIREYEKASEEESRNVVNVKQQNYRPLLISSPRKKRASHNPNLMATYQGNPPEAPPSRDVQLFESDPRRICKKPRTNRSEGVSNCFLLETGKSHNYLTAGAVLSNPFHVPSKRHPPHPHLIEEQDTGSNQMRSETRI